MTKKRKTRKEKKKRKTKQKKFTDRPKTAELIPLRAAHKHTSFAFTLNMRGGRNGRRGEGAENRGWGLDGWVVMF